MMTNKLLSYLLTSVLIMSCYACAPMAIDDTGIADLTTDKATVRAKETAQRFRETKPELAPYFKSAIGYAVFPSVFRVGMWTGAAYGSGSVFEREQLIGRTYLWQLVYGFMLGGQAYSNIIFFKDKQALEEFKQGSYEFVGHAGVAFLTYGVLANPEYSSGVAVFTDNKFGLLLELTPGLMGLIYKPLHAEIAEFDVQESKE